MLDTVHHECGIAFVRLRKPYAYYTEKYGSPVYAANKMYLLMEKQHNRGQDGAGVATIKLDTNPGIKYIDIIKSVDSNPIATIFKKINKRFKKVYRVDPNAYLDSEYLKEHVEFASEIWLGHLRYGTHGENSLESVHPFYRQNNWRSRNLVVAGNFNLTNVDQLFDKLVSLGQHPTRKADTVTVMEKIAHFLDEEVQRQFDLHKPNFSNLEISVQIEDNMDVGRILRRSFRDFDGGYAIAGLIGSGSTFVARDPGGIRPAYYYADDEVIVAASEKPAIKTAFGVEYNQIREIDPGHALVVNKAGDYSLEPVVDPIPKKSCSFERIYFSRSSDPDIYKERKELGRQLVPSILEAIDYDLEHTVFSYIPNSAETAFYGLMNGMENHLIDYRVQAIREGRIKGKELEKALSFRPRVEKLVIKDAKLRTFITEDRQRQDLVSHVYDSTYEVIEKGVDTIVVIDDSIVRGTTLEQSILTLLSRLEPKKVVMVSSAPQIRYPDCYGIDMSRLKEFVAFRAMLALLKETKQDNKLEEVYEKCRAAFFDNLEEMPNYVKELYDLFTYEQISAKVSEIVKPEALKAELEVVYQTVKAMHEAIPHHKGDWYFTGDYPTPGGYRVVNRAFMNFMQGVSERAY